MCMCVDPTMYFELVFQWVSAGVTGFYGPFRLHNIRLFRLLTNEHLTDTHWNSNGASAKFYYAAESCTILRGVGHFKKKFFLCPPLWCWCEGGYYYLFTFSRQTFLLWWHFPIISLFEFKLVFLSAISMASFSDMQRSHQRAPPVYGTAFVFIDHLIWYFTLLSFNCQQCRDKAVCFLEFLFFNVSWCSLYLFLNARSVFPK